MTPRFKPGDQVSTARWDKTVPPRERIKVSTVTEVKKARCESGFMVALDSNDVLDQGWLELVPEELRL